MPRLEAFQRETPLPSPASVVAIASQCNNGLS
jgi:hypothetical protein